MTESKKFKARVRARTKRTGESYATARQHVEAAAIDGPGATGAAGVPTAVRSGPPPSRRSAFRESRLAHWRSLVERLGNGANRVEWVTLERIVTVLNEVGRLPDHNHMFFPDVGGLDLSGATPSWESGCIELECGSGIEVLRPKRLVLTVPTHDPLCDWAFFWLETAALEPSGVYPGDPQAQREDVLEVRRGEYVNWSHWASDTLGVDEAGNDVPLPPGKRPITRHFRGAFLIVSKGGAYNALPSGTYEGQHSKMGEAEFARTIQGAVDEGHRLGRYGRDLSPRA